IARLRFMAKRSRELLAASGANDIFETYSAWDWWGATHVFGTCRMGADPASSLVNADGRSHRWRNLWIADGSDFPSSGGGEAPALRFRRWRCAQRRKLDFRTDAAETDTSLLECRQWITNFTIHVTNTQHTTK